MEKQPHQEYRDNLAEKLKDIRNDPELENGKIEAFEYLEKEKESEKYKEALSLHQEDINLIIEEKNLDDKIKLSYITKGDLCIRRGLFKDATEAYKKAGIEIPKEKIIKAVIDEYSSGNREVFYSCIEAGIEIPKEKFIELGDIAVKNANLWDAQDFYRKAGIEISKEKLIEIGDVAVEKGSSTTFFLSYHQAGLEISKEKLIKLADIALVKGRTADALEAYYSVYKELLPKEKLIEIGDIAMKNNNLMDACFAYDRAGSREKLIEVANAYVKKGVFEYAIQIYEALKNKTNLYPPYKEDIK